MNELRRQEFIENNHENLQKDKLTESEPIIINSQNDNINSCCFIIFHSTRNKDEAQNILDFLNKNDKIENVKIDEWINPYSGTIYYRIRSQCFDNSKEAFIAKNKLNVINLRLTPVIKCY